MTGNVLKLLLYSNREVRVIMNNYRPISVISVVAKLFERITYDQVYANLSEHSIISKRQSGFRSIHSTVTALLEATNSWALILNVEKLML